MGRTPAVKVLVEEDAGADEAEHGLAPGECVPKGGGGTKETIADRRDAGRLVRPLPGGHRSGDSSNPRDPIARRQKCGKTLATKKELNKKMSLQSDQYLMKNEYNAEVLDVMGHEDT